ncbi:glycoside hydrolase [Trametes elegans]|nr:glycoside hydrolase [Trametes elegans]
MFFYPLSCLFTVCWALSTFRLSLAAPHARQGHVPVGPKFVVYTDADVGGGNVLPPLDRIKGFNVINLAFLLTSGPADQAANWAALPSSQRKQLKRQYNGAGVSLVVSAFGATEHPTSQDPTAVANELADFVLSHDLDGIDIDYEEFELVTARPGVGEAWLVALTKTLRAQLPKGQFILSHAPVGPWFQPGFCPGECYLTVDQEVSNLIDWYNIQFYNQSPSPGYDDCSTLLHDAGGSSILEITKSGVDVDKLVIGKPGTKADVTNGGFIDPDTLGKCVKEAVSNGWKAGVMAFQFPHADSAWISVVKGNSFED